MPGAPDSEWRISVHHRTVYAVLHRRTSGPPARQQQLPKIRSPWRSLPDRDAVSGQQPPLALMLAALTTLSLATEQIIHS